MQILYCKSWWYLSANGQLHGCMQTQTCAPQSHKAGAVTSSPCSWHMISHPSPYMSCGLSPSREVTVFRKHHAQQLTFLSSSAMPRKCHQSPFLWPPSIKALDLVYIGAANSRVRRCILIQLAQFRGQTRREGLSGFIRFEHRLIGCYYCLHVYER